MQWYSVLLLALAVLLGLFAVYVFFLFLCSLWIDTSREYETDSKFYRALLVGATWLLCRLTRLQVEVKGMEKMPEGRFLVVCNHRSNYDPMITWVYFRKYHIAYISKHENFQIPIFGRFIRKCAFMEINREDTRKAMDTIQSAVKRLKNDVVSIGVYPEGTRAHTEELLPFRNGCFKIAKQAGVPVVVLAMEGTQNIHKMSPWHRVKVTITVADVISAEEVLGMRTNEIGVRAKTAMEAVLKEEYNGSILCSVS